MKKKTTCFAEKRDWYWDGGFYGHRAHYFLWRTGQPDLTNSKNCVYSPYAGEWMSADCDNFHSPRVFICQRKLTFQLKMQGRHSSLFH